MLFSTSFYMRWVCSCRFYSDCGYVYMLVLVDVDVLVDVRSGGGACRLRVCSLGLLVSDYRDVWNCAFLSCRLSYYKFLQNGDCTKRLMPRSVTP